MRRMKAQNSTVICLLGMHRSGTSFLARLLNHCGFSLGASRKVASFAEDNPRGFWEHRGLRRVNQRLLETFGGSWDYPPHLPADWLKHPGVARLKAEAIAMIQHDFDGLKQWCFKDPRSALLVGFWREVLPVDTRWLICVRNPLEVIDSLSRRDGFQAVIGEYLWETYNSSALNSTMAHERSIVLYNQLLEDPVGEMRRIMGELNLPSPTESMMEHLRREVDPDLHRNRRGGSIEVLENRWLSADVKEMFQALSRADFTGDDSKDLNAGLHGQQSSGAGHSFAVPKLLVDDSPTDLQRLMAEIDWYRNRVVEWRNVAQEKSRELDQIKWSIEFRLMAPLRKYWRHFTRRKSN